MKQIFKNAIVYKAHLPSLETMQRTLDDQEFTPPNSLEAFSYGFVPVADLADKVIPISEGAVGGYAFAVRIDTKVVPASAVNEELKRRVAQWEEQTGYKAGRQMRKELREAAMAECVANALCRSTIITCLYNAKEQFLFVNTTSKTFADHVMKLLIRTMSSCKTETIHVSGVSNSLTTRVTEWLSDRYTGEPLFADLEPCDSILLQGSNGKIGFLVDDLLGASSAINAVLNGGFAVKCMGLTTDLISFKLTDDFKIRSIKLIAGFTNPEEDPYGRFQQQAFYELSELTYIVRQLVSIFEYKEPTYQNADAAENGDGPDTLTDESDEADQVDESDDDDDWDDAEDDVEDEDHI